MNTVVPESRDAESSGRFDVGGAALTVIALGALTWALIAAPHAPAWAVAGAALVTVSAAAAFLLLERRLSELDGTRLTLDHHVRRSVLRDLPAALLAAIRHARH